MSVHKISILAVTLAIGLATAGCSPGESTSDSSVTIALPSALQTLDPQNTVTVATDLSVLSHIYPRLIHRDADLKLQPELATAWEMVDDTTWRFKLQPGATFENGEKLDAATVKWNIDRVLDPKTNARVRPWLNLVKAVNVIDPQTVDIVTEQPFPALAGQLSMFMLLPPQWTSQNNPAKAVMPGGAYKITESLADDHVTLEARPGYWGPPPAIKKVTFRIIPEVASRVAALDAGEVDLVSAIPVEEIERINARGAAHADSIPSTRTVFLKLNHGKSPMGSKAFRQALNYGLDKEAINKSIFGGRAPVAACQQLTDKYFGYNPELKAYPYDPERAKRLIAQSGVDVRQPIDLDLPTGTYLNGSEVAQAAAAYYSKLGLTFRIHEMEFGAYMNKYVKSRNLAQSALLSYSWSTLDADGLLTLSSPGNAYDYWNDAAFGQLLAEARSTADAGRRTALYKQATARMCDEAAVVFLYVQPFTYGVSKRVVWKPRGDDWMRATDMTLAP